MLALIDHTRSKSPPLVGIVRGAGLTSTDSTSRLMDIEEQAKLPELRL